MNIQAGRDSLRALSGNPPLGGIYYVSEERKPYVSFQKGEWVFESEAAIRRYLKELGYAAGDPLEGEHLNEINQCLVDINHQHSIAGTGEIGWLTPGIHEINRKRVLVTGTLPKREPVQGEWEMIRHILTGLLGEDVQFEVALARLSLGVKGFYLEESLRRLGQTILFAGDPATGKSFVQHKIITPLFGGRSEDPYQWLTKPNAFNDHLFAVVHLAMEDQFSEGTKKQRQLLAAALKRISAATNHTYRAKYKPEFSLAPYWFVTISLNKEPQCLRALPELSRDVLDKIIAFICTPVDFEKMGPRFKDGVNLWEKQTDSEIPAFLYYLLYQHRIPASIADPRYGVMSYIAPEVQKIADLYSNDTVIFTILGSLYTGIKVVKTSIEVLSDLESSQYRATTRQYIGQNETLSDVFS